MVKSRLKVNRAKELDHLALTPVTGSQHLKIDALGLQLNGNLYTFSH